MLCSTCSAIEQHTIRDIPKVYQISNGNNADYIFGIYWHHCKYQIIDTQLLFS